MRSVAGTKGEEERGPRGNLNRKIDCPTHRVASHFVHEVSYKSNPVRVNTGEKIFLKFFPVSQAVSEDLDQHRAEENDHHGGEDE
jgi:hypothetical protein